MPEIRRLGDEQSRAETVSRGARERDRVCPLIAAFRAGYRSVRSHDDGRNALL